MIRLMLLQFCGTVAARRYCHSTSTGGPGTGNIPRRIPDDDDL
jgi:hypothetical protein